VAAYIISSLLFADGLENLEAMLDVIRTFGDQLPVACQNTCEEAWLVFDAFLSKYGSDYEIAERTTRVLRHALYLFGNAALPICPSVLARMSIAFETTGCPGYLWIAGKIIDRFGNEESPGLRAAFQEIYVRATTSVVGLLQVKSPGNIPDGLFSLPVVLGLWVDSVCSA
jgi:transportin-3